MTPLSIAIVGAGLSGLRTASLLATAGVDSIILEGRSRTGGRAYSVGIANSKLDIPRPRYDLGGTWFWPDGQTRIRDLVTELGLSTFPQFSKGAMQVERYRLERVQSYPGPLTSTLTMRFTGGTQSLIERLQMSLPSSSIKLNATVRRIVRNAGTTISITLGNDQVVHAKRVVLALPPRLIARNISFDPPLSDSLTKSLLNMPTWVGSQAKTLSIYDAPFWRDSNLSGMASSFIGPMQEIHDASPLDGTGALMGFSSLSPAGRLALGEERLRELAVAQLERLFGKAAGKPLAVIHKDWAQDPYTATADDFEPPNEYPAYGIPSGGEDLWDGQLIFAGSETSNEHPGYLEGALSAAARAADSILTA